MKSLIEAKSALLKHLRRLRLGVDGGWWPVANEVECEDDVITET